MYVAERIIFCIKVQRKDIFESIWGKYSFQGARETQPSWKITEILGVVNTRQVDKLFVRKFRRLLSQKFKR